MTTAPTALPKDSVPPEPGEQTLALGATYSQEELIAASEELSRLTPEAYLRLCDYMVGSEEQLKLPEARVSLSGRLYYKSTQDYIMLTIRGEDPLTTVDEYMKAVRYSERHGLVPLPPEMPVPEQKHREGLDLPGNVPENAGLIHSAAIPAQEQPAQPTLMAMAGQPAQPVQQVQQAVDQFATIPVRSVKHVISPSGKHTLVVKSDPPYHKFGVTAYDEVAVTVVPNFAGWPIGHEYTSNFPDAMKYARILIAPNDDGKMVAKKVVKFLANQTDI